MAEVTLQQLASLLRKSRLLDAAAQRKVDRWLERASGPEELADRLVNEGLLTEWQRSQLLRSQTGFVLDHYRLLSPVGRGGMGHVFRARDDRSGEIVAIKVMARRLSANQVLVDRFRREIRASSQLSSPHVVRAVDAGRVGRVDFMVMEFVNGDQLDRIAGRVGALPCGLACEIIRQAATGLQHAFEGRMVHRDIKPSNLIVHWDDDGLGTVKIMDLGLVRLEQEELEDQSVTRTGQVMGTPDYMSPEQAWNTARADIRSDIYSLGCTFFRLLTGRVPFPGDNPLQVLMARCSKDGPLPGAVRPDVPEPVQQIVGRMMKRDPSARYQTPGEVATELLPFCSPMTSAALRSVIPTSESDNGSADATSSTGTTGGQDVEYEQFLQDMDSGATVDLLAFSSPDVMPDTPANFAPRLPAIDSSPANGRRRRSGSQPWILSGAIAAVVMLAVLAIATRSRQGETAPANGSAGGPANELAVDSTAVTFAPGALVEVRIGETATIPVVYEVTNAPRDGAVLFRLTGDAPPGATIDARTGIVTWTPPASCPAGDYTLTIEACSSRGDQTRLVGGTAIDVTVRPMTPVVHLESHPPLQAPAGQRLTVPVAAVDFTADRVNAAFRIASGFLAGMTVDPRTGVFAWQPSSQSLGSHDVRINLIRDGSDEILATAQLTLIVVPTSLRVTLPEFPVQRALAGARFELKFADQPLPAQAVQIVTGPAAPEGVEILGPEGKLVWDIPSDASGRVEFVLSAQPASKDYEFTPDSRATTTIIIDVDNATPVTPLPNEGEIATAMNELRELFRRDLASARTAAAKAELAAGFLERSYPRPAGAADFAMLELATELADRANAFALLFEIELRRAERYGTREAEKAADWLPRLKRGSLKPGERELVIEHCLRLAWDRLQNQQSGPAAAFLGSADSLLRNSGETADQRQMAEDITQARALAESLDTVTDPTTRSLRSEELERLVKTWQFRRLFDQPDTLSFIQDSGSTTPLPESGRTLWSFSESRLLMRSAPRDGITGFIETTRKPERFVIRLQVAPGTSSASLLFGGDTSGELAAYLLVLEAAGFGRLQQLPGPATVREAGDTSAFSPSRENFVEVIGSETQLAVRVNGIQLYSTRVPRPVGGQIGLLSSLVRPDPGAAVDIRRPRLLILSDP